jgi:hypothetical protein
MLTATVCVPVPDPDAVRVIAVEAGLNDIPK